MAQHPERFMQKVIAELSGVLNKKGLSPFWENVGRHFFKMTFEEADQLILASNKQFIEDFMPQSPLYVPLLHSDAQAVIGQPNQYTIPAMKILEKEGFNYNHYVHIFDAGPVVEARLLDIRTVAQSKLSLIKSISDEVKSVDYLIANTELDFKATISPVLLNDEDGSCIIGKETADTLHVECGDRLRIARID
jgi:arginine N-succinyltransferase